MLGRDANPTYLFRATNFEVDVDHPSEDYLLIEQETN